MYLNPVHTEMKTSVVEGAERSRSCEETHQQVGPEAEWTQTPPTTDQQLLETFSWSSKQTLKAKLHTYVTLDHFCEEISVTLDPLRLLSAHVSTHIRVESSQTFGCRFVTMR